MRTADLSAPDASAPGLARVWSHTQRLRRRPWGVHLLLLLSIAIIAFPLYYAISISSQSMQEAISRPPILGISRYLSANYVEAWTRANMARLLLNSLIVALAAAIGKIVLSVLSAFAIVYFDFRLKNVIFWLIFITLMLPVPVRIVSTYQVVSTLGWINTYQGLIVPLWVSATATFLLRQFYKTVPRELADAAQVDGAGPIRFLYSILLPLSMPNIAALFVVLFVAGWNQYLWPVMITMTEEMRVVVIGIEHLVPRSGTQLPEWNIVMAAAVMALLPPVLLILFMQRWFVQGLIHTEK